MEREKEINEKEISYIDKTTEVDYILDSWLKLQKLIKEEITINEISNIFKYKFTNCIFLILK